MTKQEQFLWGIQTLVLLDANNRALEPDALKKRDLISPTGRFQELMGAIEASSSIPDDLSVQDAIHAFYYWRCHQGPEEERPARPAWVRHGDWN